MDASDELRVAVLAGERAARGGADFGAAAGHKVLLPLAGRPLIEHVLDALRQTGFAQPYLLVGDAAVLRAGSQVLDAALDAGEVVALAADGSPSQSVARALAALNPGEKLVVTTADHPLLTPQILAAFLSGIAGGTDAAAGVVDEATFRARFGDARRTFLRFSDDAISGANLFYLSGEAGGRVVRFWRRLEENRKRPWAMARAIGIGMLLRYATGTLPLTGALAALSRRTGAGLQVVRLPQAEAAVDVDRPEDLALAERIFQARLSR